MKSSQAQQAAKTYLMQIRKIECLADTVLCLDLIGYGDRVMTYKAGQFLSILLPDGQSRCYSMANPRQPTGLIELHVRLHMGGKFSQWVSRQLGPGDILQVQGPYGDCVWQLPATHTTNIIMLATGTGIAPLKALLEQALDDPVTRPISLYWGGPTAGDLYLLQYFSDLTQQHRNFRFVPVLSRADASWTGQRGYVQDVVAKDYPSLADAEVYACGTPVMVDSAKRLFVEYRSLGVSQFYADAFEASNAVVTQAPAVPQQVNIAVKVGNGSERLMKLATGQTLMTALRDAQLMQGVCGGHAACGTCRLTINKAWLERLAPVGRVEKRLIAALASEDSSDRLACQIKLESWMEGLCIQLPENPI